MLPFKGKLALFSMPHTLSLVFGLTFTFHQNRMKICVVIVGEGEEAKSYSFSSCYNKNNNTRINSSQTNVLMTPCYKSKSRK